MPYALFSNDAKLSKAYPTEADVWKVARKSGLVVDVSNDEEKAIPHPVLDNDYEIKPCNPEPNEDPARNKAEAEGDAEPLLTRTGQRRTVSLSRSASANALAFSSACSLLSISGRTRRIGPSSQLKNLGGLPSENLTS